MTDKFVVPEPSEEAYTKFFERTDDKWLTHLSNCLRAAYAVDVPRIVQQEVERALKERNQYEDGVWFIEDYLRRRFGEGEPERPCAVCEVCWDKQYKPTPSAPAVRIDGVLHDTNLRNTCVRCAWMPDGSLAGRCERCGQSQAVDDSENDRLARMERFLTALARIHEVGAPGDSRVSNVRAAAREYLR